MPHEFDENFRELLEEAVTNDQLPLGGYICDERSRRPPRVIQSEPVRTFIYSFIRRLFIWLCDFHRINLVHEFDPTPDRATFSQRLHRPGDKRKATRRKWPYYVLVVFIISGLTVMASVYLQYVHDFAVIRFDALKSQLGDPMRRSWLANELKIDVEHLRNQLQQAVETSRARLKKVGAPFVDWTLIIEVYIFFFALPSFVVLVVLPLAYHRGDLVMLSPILLLDQHCECRARVTLIMSELQRFVASSLSLARARVGQTCKELVTDIETDKTLDICLKSAVRDRVIISAAKRIFKQHWLTVERVRKVALGGCLNNLNRTARCRDVLTLYALATISSAFIYILFVDIYAYQILREYLKTKGIQESFESVQDVFVWLMIGVLVLICVVSSMFVAVVHCVTLFDQIGSIKGLRRLILTAVRANDRRISRLETPLGSVRLPRESQQEFARRQSEKRMMSMSDAREICNRVELDLLTVILQCRLSARTFSYARKQISYVALMVICLVAIVLLVFCLHSAYYYEEMKKFSTYVGLVCLVTGIGFLVPLGMLHEEMIATRRPLWSLCAQTSLLESMPQVNKFLDAETSITILTLRRELADSTLNKFACELFLMPITYENLIKITFWLFVVMIPLVENHRLGDTATGFMSDPFGLYNFA